MRCPNGFNCRCTMIGLTAADAKRMLEKGAPFFDATKDISYGGPDLGFIKFAERAKVVTCEPDTGWSKSESEGYPAQAAA